MVAIYIADPAHTITNHNLMGGGVTIVELFIAH